MEDSFDLDEDEAHAAGDNDLDLTAEMARLGLDAEGEARDDGEDKRLMNKYFHDRFVTIRDASED